jgi:DNA invertase Pin-like site-specific DNA recombinase
VKRLKFEKEKVRVFGETFSGFENKKRKEWTKMIEEINKEKSPCILLTRDLSRLSRNPTDTQTIMNMLY